MTVETTPRIARVTVPRRGVRHDLRAVRVVLHREILRFLADRTRIITMTLQPILWLFVLGTGIGALMSGPLGSQGPDFRTFMFPGVISMSVIMTAMFSAGSIVWDREFGFLREMLVAPISRTSILIGKCLGGALVATLQGLVIVALAGLVDVPYSPLLILTLAAEMFLAAFTITAFGVLVAVRIKNMQTFFGVVQMAVMPMLFLSGAVFPLSNLPSWLSVLTSLNPLTYAVDPLRQAVFSHLNLTPAESLMFNPGISWFDWQVPVGVQLGLISAAGLVLLLIAAIRFRRAD
ncbi:ABC transporter permease [Rhizohabitans arisaemae]|uniref:ABC transporter permease n=1 Tax=Rhizohabitans arisaemae TaxID=2720610 RepID=UPI0024B1584D|nr:ABC transporter permease [Rhizohabitans arisaemae]